MGVAMLALLSNLPLGDARIREGRRHRGVCHA